jgi:drug/metabolite transporter (DMT)-like permease
VAQRTNTLAIIALITGILCAPAGVVCGVIALTQISRTREGGKGLAIAGIVVGGLFTLLFLLGVVGATISDTESCKTFPDGGSVGCT